MTQAPSKAAVLPAKDTGRSLAKLARPQNILYSGITILLVSHAAQAPLSKGLICYALLLCLYAIAAGINNLADIQIDRTNKRTDNPLATGQLAQRSVVTFCIINAAIVIGLQLWLRQPGSLLLTGAFLSLSALYSYPFGGLQRHGYLGTLNLAICYGVLPVFLGSAQGTAIADWWILALLQLPLLIPLLLTKDYKDITGDRLHGKRTPLVRHGKRPIIAAAIVCMGIVGIFLCTSRLYDLALWLYYGAYAAGTLIIHATNAKVHPMVYRLTQLAVLGLVWRLLIVPVS